jgi:hypothetical protein
LHQVDDIIVIREGQIIEHGSFDQLMKKKGHLAKLIGEHVQIVEPASSPSLKKSDYFLLKKENLRKLQQKSTRRKSEPETNNLTQEQILSRRRFSLKNNMPDNDTNIAKHIEKNQLGLIGAGARRRLSADLVLNHNLTSMITDITKIPEDDENEVIPEDAEPMKLVLEDQSINYKKSPYASYIKAGSCLPKLNAAWFISLTSFFFLSYSTSIGRGKKLNFLL